MNSRFFYKCKQFFRYPISTVYVILGLTIAFFAIFDGLSIYNQVMKNANVEKSEKFYETLDASISNTKENRMEIGCFHTETDVNIKLIDYTVAVEGLDGMTSLTAILQDKLGQKFSLEEGRLPSKKEIEEGIQVVAIGTGWLPYVEEENNEKFIMINHIKYKVVGVIGTNVSNIADNKLVTYFNCLEKGLQEKILSSEFVRVEFESESENTYDSYKEVKDSLYQLDKAVSMDGKIIDNSFDVIQYVLNKSNFIVAAVVYLFSIANCIIISEFWIEQRKREVAIRKAFGQSNFGIIKIIFGEMLATTVIAIATCICLQAIFSNVIEKLLPISISFSIANLLITVFFAMLTTLLVISIPIYRIIKLAPAQSMLK